MNRMHRSSGWLVRPLGAPLLALWACVGVGALCGAARADERQVDFKKDIQPILKASCIKCHSEDPRNPRKHPAGGLRLDDKDAALKGGKTGNDIVPGKGEDSLLYKLLKGPVNEGGDDIDPMPKAMRGQKWKPLPPKQVELIKTWIDQGANWPQ